LVFLQVISFWKSSDNPRNYFSLIFIKENSIAIALELVVAGPFHRFSIQQLFLFTFFYCKKAEKSNLNMHLQVPHCDDHICDQTIRDSVLRRLKLVLKSFKSLVLTVFFLTFCGGKHFYYKNGHKWNQLWPFVTLLKAVTTKVVIQSFKYPGSFVTFCDLFSLKKVAVEWIIIRSTLASSDVTSLTNTFWKQLNGAYA
jgi:hypothetical protein